jgi:GH25 family lysozyme M1 (1,4-beta-N-acetylmuramidase)
MSDLYHDIYSDTYGAAMTLTLGTDVSAYQGAVNWASVARTPYRFGLARMTIGRSTRDDRGRDNLKAMVDAMPVAGAYGVVGYSEPVTDGAKFLVDEIEAAGVDHAKILVMLDAENFSDGQHPTISQVDAYAQELRRLLGRWVVSYVPAWWMRQHGYTAAGRALSNCPWAPSHYLSAPWTEAKLLANKPPLEFGFKSLAWLQYTSSASVAGVSGNVDANCFYGTLDQLRAKLLGQQEDDMTTEEHDALMWLRTNAATHNDIGIVIRGDETTDPTKDTHPDNIGRTRQDLAAGLSAVATRLDAIVNRLDSGPSVMLDPEQLADLKQAVTLEGSALIQLAVSPPTTP